MARVLVVEDDVMLRETVATLLEDTGHEVLLAGDGVAAVDALLISPNPLVVLLDLIMPHMCGDAVLRLVGEGESPLSRHEYILMTALSHALPAECSQLLRELNVPVVGKPFTVDGLLSAVETAEARLFAGVSVRR
jgi:CheY-like chemotaxis protein